MTVSVIAYSVLNISRSDCFKSVARAIDRYVLEPESEKFNLIESYEIIRDIYSSDDGASFDSLCFMVHNTERVFIVPLLCIWLPDSDNQPKENSTCPPINQRISSWRISILNLAQKLLR